VSQCAKLHVAGFSGEVYDVYNVSPEYFGYTLVTGFLVSVRHFTH
jgi:hypothetical protein